MQKTAMRRFWDYSQLAALADTHSQRPLVSQSSTDKQRPHPLWKPSAPRRRPPSQARIPATLTG